MAVAGLDVSETVVLVRRRSQRLGQQRKGVDAQRELSAARHERGAVDADEVAEVKGEQAVHRLGAEHVEAGLKLDAARAILEIQERHLALAAPCRQTPGDAVRDLGLLARRQPLVGGAHRRDRLDPAELVRERLDAGRAQ